jgi:hypothetical protein
MAALYLKDARSARDTWMPKLDLSAIPLKTGSNYPPPF